MRHSCRGGAEDKGHAADVRESGVREIAKGAPP